MSYFLCSRSVDDDEAEELDVLLLSLVELAVAAAPDDVVVELDEPIASTVDTAAD